MRKEEERRIEIHYRKESKKKKEKTKRGKRLHKHGAGKIDKDLTSSYGFFKIPRFCEPSKDPTRFVDQHPGSKTKL